MKMTFKVDNIKVGFEFNIEEAEMIGKGVIQLAEMGISVQDIVQMVTGSSITKEKESEEPEEATEDKDDKIKDELVEKLKDQGCEVLEFGDDDLIECHTFCDTTSNKEKCELVRAWLKKEKVKYTMDSYGVKKYVYMLTPIQLIELQRYLKDNDNVAYDVIYLI